jgi:nucleoside-diphosphate-sugar epimerase
MGEARRALVTGSSGFVGSHLLRHLAGARWRIAVLTRPRATDDDMKVTERYNYAGSTEDVCRAVKEFQPDVVFHLASLFLVQHRAEDVKALIDSNVLLGTQLLEGMRLARATALVNAGTGWQSFKGPAYEPANLYAATKQAFEDIAAYYVPAAGLRCITLRLFDSYGPGDTRRKLLRVMLDALRTGAELEMSPGDQVIDLAHVDDICRAFMHAGEMALAQREPGAAVYAVSGGQRLSVREVAAVLEEAAGKRLPLRFGARPHREREVMAPWHGPGLPGWEPQVRLLDGFRRLVEDEPTR